MWRNFPLITEASRRLQNVVIENKDFEKLIAQYDRPNTIFYLDPPYYETEDYYEDVGFGRADHERLCNALMKIKGKFLLSYNDCPEIRELYSREGIMIESTTRLSNIAQRYDAGKQYPELLISNYDTYYDESNNCLKFKFKDENGDLNVDYTEDYVLAGVAFEGTEPPVDIDAVFSKLQLQKSITDIKLKHLIGKVPEGTHKFLHTLNSAKVESVLSDLLAVDNLFIHWSAINLIELERMFKNCPEMLSPIKVSRWTPLGKNRVYELIKSKELKSFIYQGAYMISKVDLLEYLADHSEEQGVRHYRIKNGGQS